MGYTLIASQVLSASASSITFSSIPQTYKALKLLASARTDTNGGGSSPWAEMIITVNGGAGTTSGIHLYGTGSIAGSDSGPDPFAANTNNSANAFSVNEITFSNYSSSNPKVWSIEDATENNGTLALASAAGGLNTTTSGITSITLTPNPAANFVAASSFYLYGLS